jgi:flagellar hook-length control protein FliK
MPELMITPTPPQLPGNAGNANALSQSDAPARSGDSTRTDTDGSQATPFASVLKSRMDKQAAGDAAEDSAAATAATARTDALATTIPIDLAGLFPLLGITPGTAATAAVDTPEAAVDAAAAPGMTLAPTVTAVPQTPGAQPAAVAVQAETTGGAEPELAARTLAMDPGSRKPLATTTPEPDVAPAAPKAEALAQMPGKIAPDPAINADTATGSGETLRQEGPAGDFRTLLDRAAAMPTGQSGTASPASPGPGLRVDTPLGQSGWHEEMGQKLTWMVANNRQQADLVLTPPQLGRVEVSLTMNGDQATAIFTSANPAVREALEGSLQRLREVLADAGVSLGQTQVGSESPSQSSRQEERGFGTEQGVRYAATVALPGSSATVRSGAGRGMVDVFA